MRKLPARHPICCYRRADARVSFPPRDAVRPRAGVHSSESNHMESSNVLGTLWAAFGMTAYYIALVWINTLLGIFLTPLFLIPLTWLQDRVLLRRRGEKPRDPRLAH